MCTSSRFCCGTVQLGATAELGAAADFSYTAICVAASALNSTGQPQFTGQGESVIQTLGSVAAQANQ